MTITATELKENLGKYLAIALTEDVFVTKNGKGVVKLTSLSEDRAALARSLVGAIPANVDLRSERKERISKYESAD